MSITFPPPRHVLLHRAHVMTATADSTKPPARHSPSPMRGTLAASHGQRNRPALSPPPRGTVPARPIIESRAAAGILPVPLHGIELRFDEPPFVQAASGCCA